MNSPAMESLYAKYKTRIGYTLCAFSVAILTVSVLKPLVDSAPTESYKQMYQTILVFMCVGLVCLQSCMHSTMTSLPMPMQAQAQMGMHAYGNSELHS